MFCPNCQQELPDGAAICLSCGKHLPASERPSEDYQPVEVVIVRDKTVSLANKIIWSGVIAVAGWLFLVIVAQLLFPLMEYQQPAIWGILASSTFVISSVVVAYFLVSAVVSLILALSAIRRQYREENYDEIRRVWQIIIFTTLVVLYFAIVTSLAISMTNYNRQHPRVRSVGFHLYVTCQKWYNETVELGPSTYRPTDLKQ